MYFPQFLDVTSEQGFYMSQDIHQMPGTVELPLKVPFSSVRARYWEWHSQVYSHEVTPWGSVAAFVSANQR